MFPFCVCVCVSLLSCILFIFGNTGWFYNNKVYGTISNMKAVCRYSEGTHLDAHNASSLASPPRP